MCNPIVVGTGSAEHCYMNPTCLDALNRRAHDAARYADQLQEGTTTDEIV